ncbi:MAG: hypothetical protein HKO59_05565 [Phycisphaerales bacterium]|nr:hypothetical protein [Phycisphaerales bacterium]NNM25440.1 hypothetical protein [Phycisphaerales bacterium]
MMGGNASPDLGVESDTERAVKRVLPWVLSLAAHVGMIIFGFLVTWTVVRLQSDTPPVVIVADFDAMTYEPLARLTHEQVAINPEVTQDRSETDWLDERLNEALDESIEPLDLISNAASGASMTRFAPDPLQAVATFVGLSSTNARQVVYVIDASGSMIRSLPLVLDELARSLDGLTPRQEFGVIFFTSNRAVVVPPADRLTPASDEEVARVLAWIDANVIPAGRSNPLAALEQALRHQPDVIFLLSEDITGSGEFEIDQADLLALLDRLNPRDPRNGRRVTRINCVQFLDPDPLGTLERIAEEHGGAGGYKLLDRAELGLRAP